MSSDSPLELKRAILARDVLIREQQAVIEKLIPVLRAADECAEMVVGTVSLWRAIDAAKADPVIARMMGESPK